MNYLLDTNILVDYLRGKKKLKPEQVKTGIGMSIMTLAELVYGAYKSRDREQSLEDIEKVIEDFEIELIMLDPAIIFEYGSLKAHLEQKGQRLDEFDLLIAATAKVKKMVLVTRNQRHFRRIRGISLEDSLN